MVKINPLLLEQNTLGRVFIFESVRCESSPESEVENQDSGSEDCYC